MRAAQDAAADQRVGGRGRRRLRRAPASVAAGAATTPSPSTAAARASAPAAGPRRASRAPISRVTRSGSAPPRPPASPAASERASSLQQERVAAGRAVARAAERVVGARARSSGRAPPPPPRPAAARRARSVGVPAQGVQRRRGLLGAARHDERDRDALEPVGEVGERAERRRVGPVGVVDQHAPAGARRRGSRSASRARGGRRTGPRPARAASLDAEHRRGEPRGAGEQLARSHDRLEQLADDAEAERALELRAARAQDEQPGRLGAVAAAASISAVLPAPAAPSISTSPPAPAAERSSAACSAVISASRSSSRPGRFSAGRDNPSGPRR